VRKLLMISPFFMPMSAVGAKRALHFSRHLPQQGWKPAVIALPETIDKDPSLLPLVPEVPLLRIYRSGPVALIADVLNKFSRSSPLQISGGSSRPGGLSDAFDRYSKYQPHVFLRALFFLLRHRCELIYANAGPFSALELGAALARVTQLPFVADLRDPWSIEPNYIAARSNRAQRLVSWRESRCFAAATQIVVNTESARLAYVTHYAGKIPSDRFTTIRNSFDPELYGLLPEPPGPDEPFKIIYYGHLRSNKNAVQFLSALSMFIRQHDLGTGSVEFITLGKRTNADSTAIQDLGLCNVVKNHEWLPFTRCRELLGQADLLLDLMGPDHHLQISGKFYDYLACRRPILCISPNPEMDTIFATTKAGWRVTNEVSAICAALNAAWTHKRANLPFSPDNEVIADFTAVPATRQLAEIFNRAINNKKMRF